MKGIPVGTRVVLVEDHRASFMRRYTPIGSQGVVLEYDSDWEREHDAGGYYILFDTGGDWYINESAVAPFDSLSLPLTAAQERRALAMALELEALLREDARQHFPSSLQAYDALCTADWLRAEVIQALEGGTGE